MVRRALAAVMTAVVMAGVLTAVAEPTPALAATGPSVPLPGTPSTSVQPETVTSREPDQATKNALTGNQSQGSAPKDGGGTPRATSLAPSASWQVSPQTGDFTWSYPLRVPPAPGGLVPNLALSYTSSAVDGRTSATNNQASWIGDGWALDPGYIERSYGACAEDTMGDAKPPQVGDLCWRSDNATASYSGGGGSLICCDADGRWRTKSDDGSRVERLTGAANGDDNGEYWKITTVDGTQYFFGSRPEAKSTWSVPVFGDDTGEPCHQSTFDASHCTQAWRWNLDKVIDRHGNVMTYGYDAETNSYGMNLKDAAVSYVRGGTLRTIEYGMHDDQPATGQVVFSVADRCVPGSDCTPDKKDNWPDVPWDAKCDTATCKDHYAPTFWSTKRLAAITTKVRGAAGFTDVETWTLDQQFPNPGDGEKAALWLKGIVRTGSVGGSIALPAVTFEGTMMPNRVYKVDGLAPLNRYRITGVISETGGLLSVKYANPDCVEGSSMPANAETNTLRCFPVRWNKKDNVERTDYFHKYVVESVVQSDRFAAQAAPITANTQQVTTYEYVGGAAWHYDTSEFTKEDKKTWDEFRGFGKVLIRTGAPNDPGGPIGKTEQRFYRGMNGDKLPSGTRTVTVQATEGPARADEDWLQGARLETITYDGDTDRVVSKAITEPSWQGPTATRGVYKAYVVRTGATSNWTALAAGGWRTTRTESTYDDRGLITSNNDLGDTATAADDRCTRTWYAHNPDRWLINFVSRSETVAVRCDATASYPADAISDTRTAYDGKDVDVAPTTGDVTTSQELSDRPASGPIYVTTATTKYDGYGRVIEAGDALGRVTRTDYTPVTGGPITQTVVTNPLGHTVTTTLEPAWGLPTVAVDANKRKTETAYDALGRMVEVWLPNRARASHEGSAKFSYLVRGDAPTVVTTSRVGPNGNYTSSKEIYDGLLRPRQTQEPAEGGGRLLTDVRYDSQGRVYKSTQHYFNDAAIDDNIWVASDVEVPGLTATEYDGAGRKNAEIFKAAGQEQWRTTTTYGGDRVHVTPPAGGTASTTISDGRGQTVEARQYRGGTPSGAYDSTRYTYTTAGQLASTTDPAGNTWRFGYDLRGNQVRTEDVDKGTSTMTYDAAGQLLTSTDGRGSTLTYGYDLLGRKKTLRAADTTVAEWTYDTAVKGKGQLASSTRYVGGAAYTRKIASYTEMYHPYESSVTIPETEQTLAGTYTTYSTFNPDDSPYGTALPAIGDLPKETVAQEYDDLGNPTKVSGGPEGGPTVNYVTGTDYTRYGETARIQLGEVGKRVWLSYYYDTSTRRLARTIVDAEVSRPMQTDVNYTYDPAGNVTSIANTPQDLPADVQCFRYDYLRRLAEAWTPGAGCAAAPDKATLAGAAPYWQSFSYDAVGNRITETQHAVAGDTTRDYAYPSAGAHRLASVSTDGPAGKKKDDYGYDAAGNTVARPGQQLSWDAEGKLSKVTEGDKTTEFEYDADGARLIRRDPEGATLYLDGQDLRLDKATGKLTGTRYYQHGDDTVATRTAVGVTWEAGDHQDTAQIAIDSASQKVNQRRQAPFGAPRGTPVPWAGDKGFVGGVTDASTGLTHLGARDYDPLVGRFISVDPVMDLSDPQQMHGYTYSNNSPVTQSDPTGLLWGWLKKVGNAIANVTKYAAPILGAVAVVAIGVGAVVATGGLAAAIAGGVAAYAGMAGTAAGVVNALHACTGGGSGVDCAMEVGGLVPGVGRLGVGAAKAFVRTGEVAFAREAKALTGTFGNGMNASRVRAGRALTEAENSLAKVGTNPRQWVDQVGQQNWAVAGDYTMLAGANAWSACGLSAPQGQNCLGLPSIGSSSGQPVFEPFVKTIWPSNYVELPRKVYRPGFIGPIPRGATRARDMNEWNSIPNTRPAVPAPAPPSNTYTTRDGRVCNRGGGLCAI